MPHFILGYHFLFHFYKYIYVYLTAHTTLLTHSLLMDYCVLFACSAWRPTTTQQHYMAYLCDYGQLMSAVNLQLHSLSNACTVIPVSVLFLSFLLPFFFPIFLQLILKGMQNCLSLKLAPFPQYPMRALCIFLLIYTACLGVSEFCSVWTLNVEFKVLFLFIVKCNTTSLVLDSGLSSVWMCLVIPMPSLNVVPIEPASGPPLLPFLPVPISC